MEIQTIATIKTYCNIPLFSPQPHGALEEHVTVHFDIVNPGNNVDPPKLPTYVSLNIS